MTKEGEKFIQETRVYLLTRGVNEEEIDSFLMEAEDHITEGEKEGKTVKQIFGQSPKAYANELIDSMDISTKENINLIARLMAGIFGIFIVSQLIDGNNSFSLIEIIGYPVSLVLWVVALIGGLRITSFRSGVKSFLIIYGIVILPMFSTAGVALLHIKYGNDILFLSEPIAFMIGGVIVLALITNFTSLIGVLSSILFLIVIFGAQLLVRLLQLEGFAWEMGAYGVSMVGLLVLMTFRERLPKRFSRG
ncbi:MAG: hypothetical protein WCF60_11280 [Anaerobacillus sp.]